MLERGYLAEQGIPSLDQLAAGPVIIGASATMSFNRVFFKNIGDLVEDYYKVYP